MKRFLMSLVEGVKRACKGPARPARPQRTSLSLEALEDRRALSGIQPMTAAVLQPVAFNLVGQVLQQKGSQTTANDIYNAFAGTTQQALNLGHLGSIGNWSPTAKLAQDIINNPLVNQGIQHDPTALYIVGPGFTPQTYNTVNGFINRHYSWGGATGIDFTGVAKAFGLTQIDPALGQLLSVLPGSGSMPYVPFNFASLQTQPSNLGQTSTQGLISIVVGLPGSSPLSGASSASHGAQTLTSNPMSYVTAMNGVPNGYFGNWW
jgi:hypothetical protein